LRLSIELTITPKPCKDFQKENIISIKVIFLSINPGVISRKVGSLGKMSIFSIYWGIFQKGKVHPTKGTPLKKRPLCKVVGSL
jgi:hypothetical protein